MPQHAVRRATIAELRSTDLEFTTVHVGQIADYFGIPHIKGHLAPLSMNVDMANKAAAIPGTGNEVLLFTYSFDLARFVEAALDLPHWDEQLFCYGDRCTLDDVVRMAEEATGSKFAVTYDGVEKLKRGEVTELPSHLLAYPYFP
jgi:nucleoside-diphosphate-sugar epimerase